MALEVIYQSVPVKDCLKATDSFSERVYHNVCSGVSHAVPNGFYDHVCNGLIVIAVASVCAVLISVAWRIAADW